MQWSSEARSRAYDTLAYARRHDRLKQRLIPPMQYMLLNSSQSGREAQQYLRCSFRESQIVLTGCCSIAYTYMDVIAVLPDKEQQYLPNNGLNTSTVPVETFLLESNESAVMKVLQQQNKYCSCHAQVERRSFISLGEEKNMRIAQTGCMNDQSAS